MKQAVLDLPDPTNTSPGNWTVSSVITGHLVASLRGQEEFRTADHAAYLSKVRGEGSKRNTMRLEEALADNLVGAPVQVTCRLQRATEMGAWMTVQTSTVNGAELGAQEWRDSLFL